MLGVRTVPFRSRHRVPAPACPDCVLGHRWTDPATGSLHRGAV